MDQNTLSLDVADERFSSLADCENGETKTVTVTGVVTRDAEGGLSLAVESLDYEPEVEEEIVEGEEVAAPAPPAKKGGPDHPAVMVLVAKKPKAKA